MFSILLVDDTRIFRQFFRDFISGKFPGVAITEAADSIEALQKIEAHKPDLIFMDINLPGVNGLSLTKLIKKDHPSLSIIILTAYDMAEYREAAAAYGADEYIIKTAMNSVKISELVADAMSGKPSVDLCQLPADKKYNSRSN